MIQNQIHGFNYRLYWCDIVVKLVLTCVFCMHGDCMVTAWEVSWEVAWVADMATKP